MSDKLRVLLVDDHEVVRRGLKSLLMTESEIDVVGEASSGPEAVEKAAVYSPQVVVMDVRMPEGNGVEACREIRDRNPEIQVIMLTSYSDDEALFNSIMAGAAGFVLKQIHGRDLVEAIRKVGTGKSLLDPDVTQRVLDRLRKAKFEERDPLLAKLSEQEEKILELVAQGLTNRQIGEKVFLSDKTVKNYVSIILQKLEVARRAGAASYLARARAEHPPADA